VGHIPDDGFAAALDTAALRGKRFGLVGPGWRADYLPLAPETEALYQRAITALTAQGAEVVEDPFLNRGFVELYERSPNVPGAGDHDLYVYLQGLGPGAAFHSAEEWETLTGREFRGGQSRLPPARPSATEAGDAYQAWRMELRALFRTVLRESRLDGLFFPQAGAPIRPLYEDPDRPEYWPNNHPELPSNVINDLGVPVVTLPFAYYDDGMPFVLAFIGDSWEEAELLGFAHDLERATAARVAPTLEAGGGAPAPG
jgi:Asp-tRNA(Asn)/Glu-tRNA(Gln) amidotransferase A subunit family amidase